MVAEFSKRAGDSSAGIWHNLSASLSLSACIRVVAHSINKLASCYYSYHHHQHLIITAPCFSALEGISSHGALSFRTLKASLHLRI